MSLPPPILSSSRHIFYTDTSKPFPMTSSPIAPSPNATGQLVTSVVNGVLRTPSTGTPSTVTNRPMTVTTSTATGIPTAHHTLAASHKDVPTFKVSLNNLPPSPTATVAQQPPMVPVKTIPTTAATAQKIHVVCKQFYKESLCDKNAKGECPFEHTINLQTLQNPEKWFKNEHCPSEVSNNVCEELSQCPYVFHKFTNQLHAPFNNSDRSAIFLNSKFGTKLIAIVPSDKILQSSAQLAQQKVSFLS